MIVAWIKWLGQFMLMLVALPTTPILMALALPWVRPQDKENILPLWLQWLNTYDDTGCDQGMYEKHVAWIYKHLGWHFKTWYWLGCRNQCYTLFWWLAPQVQFYAGAKLLWRGAHYALEQPDGRRYFDFEWKRLAVGWKLFAIERFFSGDESGRPYFDRPTFLFRIIRVRKT